MKTEKKAGEIGMKEFLRVVADNGRIGGEGRSPSE